MKRKSFGIVITAAVAGIAATGYLVFSLLGDGNAGRVRTSTTESRAERTTDGSSVRPQEIVRSERETPGRLTTGGPNGGVRPGLREPFDAPGTDAERAQWSSRVQEILAEIQRVEDPNAWVKLSREMQQLIRKLGHRVPQTIRDGLLGMLDTADPKWRRFVGDTLGNLQGDTSTAKKLLEKLKARPEDVRTRQAILIALGKMNVKEMAVELGRMLRADYENETEIVRAIGSIGGREAAALLAQHLVQPLQPNTRTAIERALGQLKDPVVLENLELGLSEVDVQARRSTITILGMTRDDKYAASVRNVLKNESDERTRKVAIRALGFFGDKESGAALLDLVEQAGPPDNLEATRAFYHIRDPETVDALAERWDRLKEDARLAVIGAGARLTKPTERLQKLAADGLDSSNERMRTSSAQLLGRPGNDGAVTAIERYARGATRTPDRTAALQALLRIKTKKSAEAGLASLPAMSLNEHQRRYYEDQFRRIIDPSYRPRGR